MGLRTLTRLAGQNNDTFSVFEAAGAFPAVYRLLLKSPQEYISPVLRVLNQALGMGYGRASANTDVAHFLINQLRDGPIFARSLPVETLHQLAKVPVQRRALVKVGAVGSLVRVLAENVAGEREKVGRLGSAKNSAADGTGSAKKSAADALGALSANPEAVAEMAAGGAAAALVTALAPAGVNPIGSSLVAPGGLRALRAIAAAAGGRSKFLAETGQAAVPAIARYLMPATGCGWPERENAAAVLRVLSCDAASAAAMFGAAVPSRIVSVMVYAATRGANDTSADAAWILHDLAYEPSRRNALASAGALPLVSPQTHNA